jgi:ring hydroxylating enzyme beta subunit
MWALVGADRWPAEADGAVAAGPDAAAGRATARPPEGHSTSRSVVAVLEYSVTDRENTDTGLYPTKERGIVALQVRAAYLSGYWRMQRKPRVHLIGNLRVFVESDGTFDVKASVVLVRTGLDGHSQVHAAGTYDGLLAGKGEGFEILRHAVVLDADVQPYDMTDIV